MRAVRPGARASVAVALLLVGLAGCAEEGSGTKVELDDGPRNAANASPGAAPSDQPVDGVMTRGNSTAEGEAEEAVADVWFAFYAELVRTYSGPDLDRARLGEVATGAAYDGTVAYAEEQVAAGHRHAGGLVGAVSDVEVDGDRAVVTGCLRTTLTEVDAEGQPVETVEPWRVTRDVLVKQGPLWRMESYTSSVTTGCAL